MGAVAARLADRVVVTSDNPRGETPESIIDDIVEGVPSDYRARVVTNPDRRDALRDAIGSAAPGDIVVVAGKGHETTQEFADHTVAFDDRLVAAEILEARG
jgi:UDP-N-acetylmuramoyl-L-alanyl-D-glutamate--2,6-diaminopimelate ligase